MTGLPIPKPNADTQPFWDAAREKRLIYQFCRDCEKPQFYPRSLCVHCHGSELEWRESAGRGNIVTYTQVMRPPLKAFNEMTPYVIALVDLDEGFRMMVNIVDLTDADVAIGSAIKIIFQTVEDTVLPQGTLI